MKILVFGVHHWFKPSSKAEKKHLQEWHDRINKFIPNSEIFITTGCYSLQKQSPFPSQLPVIQNKIPYTKEYSVRHNYFRNGFMTGIWHALLNHENWDILFHIQPRVLLGVDMQPFIQEFINNDQYQVLAPNFYSQGGAKLEISFFGMKPGAVKSYSLGGLRNSFIQENDIYPWNTEQEAYEMFYNVRYNPWPEVFTTRQIDSVANGFGAPSLYSPFTILNIKEYGELPLISTGKHCTVEFRNHWKRLHKI